MAEPLYRPYRWEPAPGQPVAEIVALPRTRSAE
jgi:hypothetical protein